MAEATLNQAAASGHARRLGQRGVDELRIHQRPHADADYEFRLGRQPIRKGAFRGGHGARSRQKKKERQAG
jgi:hypothetical protein